MVWDRSIQKYCLISMQDFYIKMKNNDIKMLDYYTITSNEKFIYCYVGTSSLIKSHMLMFEKIDNNGINIYVEKENTIKTNYKPITISYNDLLTKVKQELRLTKIKQIYQRL
jgi:hypothetical protein